MEHNFQYYYHTFLQISIRFWMQMAQMNLIECPENLSIASL